MAGVCFAEFTDWQNLKQCPVVVQSRCEHQTLFFPALVSIYSLLHEEELSEWFRALYLVPLRILVVATLTRCRFLHSKRCCNLTRRFDNSCRYQEFLNPWEPRLAWLAFGLAASCFSGFGLVNSSVTRFVFPAVCRASAIVGISHSIAFRFLFVTSLHSEYHRELTDARVATFLLARFCNLNFSSFRFQTCFVADPYF